MQEGQFSEQFFSASMDGTIKLWDLHSKPLPKASQKSTSIHRFGFPEKLKTYKSPLHIYNNCLKPTYTVSIINSILILGSWIHENISIGNNILYCSCTTEISVVNNIKVSITCIYNNTLVGK